MYNRLELLMVSKGFLGIKAMTNLDSILKSRHYFADKGPYSQAMFFFSSYHVWIWELAEPWRMNAFKLWCWRRHLRVPWRLSKEIQLVNPKGNLSWIFIGRTDAEAVMIWLPFQWSCMDVRVGLWRRLSAEELMLLNCGVGEGSWESLGLQGDPTSPLWRRSALGFLWKEWC